MITRTTFIYETSFGWYKIVVLGGVIVEHGKCEAPNDQDT